MKINLKEGVKTITDKGVAVQPEIIAAIPTVAAVYYEFKAQPRFQLMPTCTITSICDGRHGRGSLHYKGMAFDIRTWANVQGEQLADEYKKTLANRIKDRLGSDFDVVAEYTHIHIEYDPKK